jgi:hypothetical protein
LAGRVLVVERAREAEVRLVEQLAHPRLDPDADARGRVAAREVRPEAKHGEDDDRGEVRPQMCARLALLRRDRVVDPVADQDRDRQGEARRHDRAREAEQDQAPLLAPDAQQADHGGDEAEIWRVDLHAGSPCS